MPELPEVETLRRSLERRVLGATMNRMWTSGLPLRLNRPLDVRALRRATVGKQIIALRRHAKYLLVDTDGDRSVVVHLGMTGRVVVCPPGTERAKHTHVVWSLADGRELRFVDPRRFGWVTTVKRGAEGKLAELAELGIEPLGPDLTDERFAGLLATHRRAMKAFLLDQSQVAGLGNIYVCEALFLSRIHPTTRSDRVAAAAALALRAAIVDVLEAAITHRGTSFRDYVDGEGNKGSNQFRLHVYGREGEPCGRCGAKIVRTVDGGRSTFFCPRCQKAPRRRSPRPATRL